MMSVDFRPLRTNALILLDPIDTKTASGLHLVSHEREYDQLRYGTVLAVGEGKKTKKGVLIKPEIEPGDYVVCAIQGHNPQEYMLDGKKCNLVDTDFIYGVVEK